MSSGASLNHIFRTVWNQALGAMVAVAEVGTSAGRSSGRRIKSDSLRKPPEVGIGLLALSIATAWSAFVPSVHANPTGAIAIVGQATVVNNGNAMQVTTQNGVGTNFSAINWQSFSIPAGSSTHFQQPNASSTSINRVVTNTPSQLFGSLSSNGTLVLVNQSGIAVGAGAVVDTAGFTASSVAMSDQDAMAGRLRFGDGSISTANLNVNGTILARSGDVVLLGPNVQAGQAALIQAPNGSAILAAGQQIDITGRGLEGIRLQVQAPADSVVNLGSLQGDAVAMFAGTLKHSGLIQATAVTESGGRVSLKAADVVTVAGQVNAQRLGGSGGEVLVSADKVLLQSSAVLDASGVNGGGEVLVGGGWQGHDARLANASQTVVATGAQIKADALVQGNGGTAVVWSDGATRFGGSVSARGGQQGGDGGKAEVSGKQFLDFRGTADLTASKGQVGLLLLDPDTLNIGTVADINGDLSPGDDVTGDFSAGVTPYGSEMTATQVGLLLNSANLSLSAIGNVTVASPITKASGGETTLTLSSASSGSVAINAAVSGTSGSPLNLVVSAYGNVNVNAAINTQGGSVSLTSTSVGSISQSAPITATSLSANSIGSVTLSNAGNAVTSFSGSTSSGYGTNITVNNSGPLSLGSVNVPNGALSVATANGAITQSGAVVVFNGTSLNAGTGNINLPFVSNNFNTLTMTGGQIFVRDTNDLTLGGVTATGTVETRALGNLTLSGNVSGSAGGNAVSFVTNGLFKATSGLISTPGGRWLAYLADSNLAGHAYGSNSPAFKQYNASPGSTVLGAGNGVLDATVPFLSGSVTGAVSKIYDGNTSISPSGASVTGLFGALGLDNLTSANATPASANLSDPNVGTGKAVTVTGNVSGVVGGSLDYNFFGKPIYGYQFSATGNIGSVTAAQASVSLTGSRAYDGTNIVNANIFSLSGLAPNETLTLSGAGSVADKNVGSNKTVSLDTLTLGNGTGLASNYTFTGGTAVATITPATISDITGIVASNKVYDGSTSAVVSTVDASYSGTIGSDVLTLTGSIGAFSDRNAGVGKLVTIVDLALGGVDAGNYILAATTGSASADITPKVLDMSGFVAANKVYDGTLTAALTGGSLSGVLTGDVVSLSEAVGAFSDKNVGKSKLVTVSGGVLNGPDAGNYCLCASGSSATADITAKVLNPASIGAANKVYDGTNTAIATGIDLAGAIAGDDISLVVTNSSFDTKNVGTAKQVTFSGIQLAGVDAINYMLSTTSAMAVADITSRPLTVTGVQALDKLYDGKTDASVSLSSAVLQGAVAGDAISISNVTAAFADKNVGAGKTVILSSVLSGADLANYAVADQKTAKADINPKPLTLTPTVEDKPFDNSTVATVSGYGLNGFVSGESVGVTSTSATFDSANVAANKLVSISGISLIDGTGMASNYFVPGSATARATIFDPLSLNVVNLVTVFLEKFETALEDQRDRTRSDKDRGLDNIVVEGDICLR